MIPKKEERRKTIVESFIEGIHVKQYESEKRDIFLRSVDAFFKSILDSVYSYNEWHEQLSALSVVLVRRKERKPGHILPSYLAHRWSDGPGERFLAIRNPAELEDDELRPKDDELMLVPEKTLERLIILQQLELKI